ncbi:efflux RND transporter periplasmic adaptor subunit [Sneathiella chinensis]|uniref:efflux RND transporter periplasmic adaptor subunit n=1 Tax=Sneathiella chinensis TaxID=349750 RepID=UPI00146EBE33|nr:efflux RND transporter periplasmic adaptor subunit [Sneathiella chinensis]
MTSLLIVAALATGGGLLWWNALPPAYRTAPAHLGPAVEAVYATAVVEPVEWAKIAPITTGRIVEINVQEGETVRKGQVLARIDDADLRAQLAEAEALVEFYEKTLQRLETLLKKGFESEEQHDIRETDLARAKARVSLYREKIRQLALTAPMDGTVLWRDVELGEVKQAGTALFWVGLPGSLRLEAEVDEEDIPKITPGQTVLITADAFPGKVMKGSVRWISPKGDPLTKSYRMYVSLPDTIPLMIGMTVETNTIVRENGQALLIPVDALLEGGAVWTVGQQDEKTRARKAPVTTGIRGEQFVEISSGLSEGDPVLLPPFGALEDGQEIRRQR